VSNHYCVRQRVKRGFHPTQGDSVQWLQCIPRTLSWDWTVVGWSETWDGLPRSSTDESLCADSDFWSPAADNASNDIQHRSVQPDASTLSDSSNMQSPDDKDLVALTNYDLLSDTWKTTSTSWSLLRITISSYHLQSSPLMAHQNTKAAAKRSCIIQRFIWCCKETTECE